MGRRSDAITEGFEDESGTSNSTRHPRNTTKKKFAPDPEDESGTSTPTRHPRSTKMKRAPEPEASEESSCSNDEHDENLIEQITNKKKRKHDAASDGEEYEVQAVVGDRAIKGRIQYKVRWKGYQSEDDTWENESNLDCTNLIEEYNDSKGEDVASSNRSSGSPVSSVQKPAQKAGKTKETMNKKKAMNTAKGSEEKKEKTDKSSRGPNVNGEWEVSRIVDMHTLKTGKREFLVRWVGYSPDDDSWEPEEHLKDTEILQKFLQKVERVKEVTEKELRVARKPTDRYTAMPQGDKRRESKRFVNKQRAKYYDAE